MLSHVGTETLVERDTRQRFVPGNILAWITVLTVIVGVYRFSVAGGPYFMLWSNAFTGVVLILWSVRARNQLQGRALMVLSALPFTQMIGFIFVASLPASILGQYGPSVLLALASALVSWMERGEPTRKRRFPAWGTLTLFVISILLGVIRQWHSIAHNPLDLSTLLTEVVPCLTAFVSGFGIEWLFRGQVFAAIMTQSGKFAAGFLTTGLWMALGEFQSVQSALVLIILNLLFGFFKAQGMGTSRLALAHGLFNVITVISL